ncbi:unnamed protein product, partial [Rotaria sp. Silwood1]
YCLQAFYRLCRIVFYKKKFLVSYSVCTILTICQWLLVLVFLIPPIFIDWYSRLPTEKYCLIPYTKVWAEIYHILVLYLIPLICIGTIYIWITRFMRQTTRPSTFIIGAMQRQRNQRDLTVIKRIILLVSILIALRFPTIVFMIHAIFAGYLYPFTYGIVGVVTSTCLIFIGLSTIYTTPPLRKQLIDSCFYRNNRIEAGQIPMYQIDVTGAATDYNKSSSKRKQIRVLEVQNIP